MANIKSTEQNNKISVKSTTANSTLNVRPTNLNGKVTANTGVETNTFGIKDNMSEYYARLSQDFASGEGIINGVDYSSKHYAHLSKEYAEIAEQQKNSAISSIAGFNDLAETAEKNLAQARLDYIEAINDTGDSVVVMVETTRDEAVATVEGTKENAIESIKKDADAIINRVGLNMFDTVVKDHILTYEESKGLALQGTWVYKEAIAGERCGYPDFYNKCLEEKNNSVTTEVTLGENTITMYIAPNGHQFYDIANKDAVDTHFTTYGMAWFYGIDEENERIFLPRNVWFEQMSIDDVGKAVDAGLPNITGTIKASRGLSRDGLTGSGAFSTSGSALMSSTLDKYYDPNTITLDASKSNPIYGNSDTVQPNAVKKLLYICVGNQVADTSWVDVVTQVANGAKDIEDKRVQSLSDIEQDRKQALTDLTNKENAGISALANASNALRTTQITNCLLEVPQNIKLVLNDGVLTLKASSKVIVPNGAGIYNELVVSVDKTATQTQNENRMYFYNGAYIEKFPISQCHSGETAPTGATYMFWYDTTNNKVKKTSDGGANWETGWSLPFAICTATNGAISSIDQVFNGMGYIGSTAWLDKGVKGLISNGRNKDGSLNNIEFETSSIVTRTTAGTENEYYFWCYRKDTNSFNYAVSSKVFYQIARPSGTNFRWYNPETNIWQVCGSAGNLEIRQECPIWYCSLTNGVISNFQPKQPFRAVDCSQVDGQWVENEIGLSTATAVGTYTLDLSDWLPNDGYNYEVLFYGDLSNTTTSLPHIGLGTDIVSPMRVASCKSTGSSATFWHVWNAILPVGMGRSAIYKIESTKASSTNIRAKMYRRLGTNR